MRTRDIAALLASHPLLRAIEPATIASIAGCARNAAWKAGEAIFRAGDRADALYLLRRGIVALEIAAPGRAPLRAETVRPGEILGWSWLVPPFRFVADARAVTDAGAIRLDPVCLRRAFEAEPAMGYRVLGLWVPHLAQRMQAQRVQMLDLYGTDGR